MNTPPTRGAWRRRRTVARIPRSALAAAALLLIVLGLAACGGIAAPGVASLGSPSASPSPSSGGSSGSRSNDALAFARCMRQHGITNFPDPGSRGDLTITGGSGLDPNSPQFQSAQNACRSLLPNGGQPDPQQAAAFQQAALKFAQCMRAHGIANFPDPNFSGGSIALRLPGSINPNSPQFTAAQQACQSLLPRPDGGQTTTGGPQTGTKGSGVVSRGGGS
jgi:hypothetical protein